ncbi:methylated-DNA--[protein]-cysteine S-methyltransferase [Fodinisporobacter ferrooxydans]|uniref:Methylated-DNA--protein-cysteine methyltransferase n=1 Tax=Fodinisporobacter ferrooxydans TaxID=2901836 RepID=A0ABY4CMA2_9BACL|nr:methylated-DNA--[protein]-cysteine S-methyltransferase [Alicyclobacillaceae bacterium MYW30-H2]
MKFFFDMYASPIGEIHVILDERGIRKISMTEAEWQQDQQELSQFGSLSHAPGNCKKAMEQLDEYFKGKRKQFDLPLSIVGTEFRKKVWQQLLDIPYGIVKSYSDVAIAVGNPKAVRAIGQANRANPIPIVIPCHRVIGKQGALVGYAGNRTDVKAFLLQLEGAI